MENITAAATQTTAKGGALTELAASLAISVDTVARQQQEIKRLYEHVNALKKRGTQASSVRTFPGETTVCTHCEAVGCTAPHRENARYFNPRKITDQKEWARKLMNEKVVACKDDGLRWGTAQTVINKYPIKEPLIYKYSLSCSPTLKYMHTPDEQQGHILPQQHTGIADSGATHLYISPSTPHGTPATSSA